MKKLVMLGTVVFVLLVILMVGKKISETEYVNTEDTLITYEDWCEYANEHYTLYIMGEGKSMYKDKEKGIYYVYKKNGDTCDWSSWSSLYYAEKEYGPWFTFGR